VTVSVAVHEVVGDGVLDHVLVTVCVAVGVWVRVAV
jgi:hypothetical protein